MDLTIINEVWRPTHAALQAGIRQLTKEWETLNKLKGFRQLSPRSIVWPVQLINGGGMSWTENGGSLARATSNSPVEATDTWKHLVGRFEVGFDELDAEGNPKFSQAQIEKQVRYQAADKLRAIKRAIAVGFYGYPDAVLAEAAGAGTDNGATVTITLENFYGETSLAIPARLRDYLTPTKDRVAFVNQSTGVVSLFGVLLSIDEAADTITVTTATAGTTTGHGLVLYNQVLDVTDDTDFGRGINGLLHLTKATTVHGIPESTSPDWAPSVRVANTATPLTGSMMYEDFETIEQRSDMAPKFLWTTVAAIATAGGTELDQRRYGADDNTMKIGFKNLNVMGVQAEGRPYCPAGHAFIGSPEALLKLSPDEGDVENVVETGEKAGSFQQYPDRLGFYKDQIMRAQVCVRSRAALGVRAGVSES